MEEVKKTSIGGQALIEGILMRGPDKTAIAVRKPDGDIELRVEENEKKDSWTRKAPFIRGVFSLVDSLKLGMEAVMYSASFWEDEEDEEEEGGFLDKFLEDKSEGFSNFIIIGMSLVMSLVLFFFIPTLLGSLFTRFIDSSLGLNLIEGLVRVLVFLTYITIVSKLGDMKRIFMYHGAEHKTIACYEHGRDLTVENIRPMSPYHPRCGTSFLFNVMIVSIIILSFFGWPNPLLRLLTRLAMLPVIAGITYEINKLVGRSDSVLARAISWPGKFVQKIASVKEPDDPMIEVAIAAMDPVIPEEEGKDLW